MTDRAPAIELRIPVGLTSAYIKRANQKLTVAEADMLAAELHVIIDDFFNLFSVRPPNDPKGHLSERTDLAMTMWREALGIWPQEGLSTDDGAEETVWMMERLEEIGDDGSLYERWSDVSDRIFGRRSDGLDPARAPAPAPTL
jgi:hypothetical protein